MISIGIYGWLFIGFYVSFAILCFLSAINRYVKHKNVQKRNNRLKIIKGGRK